MGSLCSLSELVVDCGRYGDPGNELLPKLIRVAVDDGVVPCAVLGVLRSTTLAWCSSSDVNGSRRI